MARNPHVEQRLEGIRKQLVAGYLAGVPMSSATKGVERETFIDRFLSQVFPPTFRFGTGDATDGDSRKSGQLDVVIEFPFAPSLPTIGSSARLYLAESVAAVIEVKSNLEGQWDEVVATAKALRHVTRQYAASMVMGHMIPYIPLFAVGYTGWKQLATLQAKVASCPEISGALIIQPGLYASSLDFQNVSATGALALWGLIRSIHVAIDGIKAATSDPLKYAM